MEQYRSTRQFGIFVVLLTLLFRLFQMGLPQGLLGRLHPRKTWDIPIQTEVGRPARPLLPFIAESAPPMDIVPQGPVFRQEDANRVAVLNTGPYQPDYGSLIVQPLGWKLAQEAPTVLILHTHATESYTRRGENYEESAEYRTLNEDYNMLSIGDRVAQLLEGEGIHVLHDRTLHDYPSYTGAYNHARKGALAILEENPQIQLVLDLHRDAAASGSGQLRTVAAIDGRSAAQIMFVLGCGNGGLPHPDWEKNLSAALKLQFLMEQNAPGLCRPISIRPQRFNQDLSTGALLVEIGAAGNTRAEALLAADQLARAILELKNG